ncbi:filamentous hemagglutinin N-terminal domain-containing protein [Burkholderia sp. BE17]|uniref:two-partner secretion domain-containing protein n=1 Tax=Burkholderia sp. BE17 TaxID=2656644 RepID=UPI001D0FADA8|nr:filamentous hemagglutinin N-terminal domain-containing protein [Burkholderia sp. BE17]
MREIEKRLVQRDAAKNAVTFEVSPVESEGHALWIKATTWVMAGVMYFGPAAFLADQTAHAALFVDPHAPIAFQPTVTSISTDVPAVNIAAPNSNGISLNQYQTFGVGPEGLVLDDNTVPGTPLLGGTLGANLNLRRRAASTIINPITSNNIAVMNGPLETFGVTAAVIVSAPGGISVNGMVMINIPGLTLTTRAPQFLTGVGSGIATDFAYAGAVAYDVRSGSISIDRPAGVNGPGAGIEGTVGHIDLIGQSVTLSAPLRADQRVHISMGSQLVLSTASGASGTTLCTSTNGATNTAAKIGKTVAVDANQCGSVTSGTAFVVSAAVGTHPFAHTGPDRPASRPDDVLVALN